MAPAPSWVQRLGAAGAVANAAEAARAERELADEVDDRLAVLAAAHPVPPVRHAAAG